MDLSAIPYLAEMFEVPVGLSDHTLENTSAIVATALGARIFEKHLTLRRSDGGPDAAFSLEPEEFADYVSKIHEAHSSIGKPRLGPSHREKESLLFRPSIRAIKDIQQGDLLTSENVATVRPGGGMHPRSLPEVIGRYANTPLLAGDPILEGSLSD
jgi:N-acetylneuraminate synthase